MRTGLFRKEAVDAQANTLDGNFLMTPKPVFSAIALLLIVWIVAVLIYLNMGSYARKASVNGWLEPSHGVFKLYSDTRRGKVIDVLVQDGEQVEAATPLITIDYSNSDASGNPVGIQLLRELEAKRERTLDNISRLQALHLAQAKTLNDQLAQAKRTLDDLDAIVALSEAHWNMAYHKWETAQSLLNKGHISHADFENQTLQRLTAEQQLTLAKKDRRIEQTNIAKLHHEIATLPKRQANEMANLENALSDLQQQIVSHKSSAEETIYAPRSGQVSGLRVKKGYTVDNARPLLTLLPVNSDIQARIAVPVRSAGFLREGQALHIRYDAFPYQKFGVQTGEITNISPSLILPGELVDVPISINEPAYLVTAKISADEILAYGNNISLRAGMTFSADVHLSQRTLMEWLMEPIYSIKGKL
ncbi:hypothetical protein BM527_17000 [Alteromonas sp. Mex14]|nr:hypothetical protein BM527_17000 [Alteromonas sp. Mex14]